MSLEPENPSVYQYWNTLTDQKDAVTSLSFSPEGKYIAATGYSGVSIWEIDTQRLMSVPHVDSADKRVFTRSAWMSFEGKRLLLILGSKRGDVTLWFWDDNQDAFIRAKRFRQSQADTEVLSMDVYEAAVQRDRAGMLVVATADHQVTMWSISSDLQIVQGFSLRTEASCCPQTVRFDTIDHTVIIFAQHGGQIARYDCQSGAQVGYRTGGPELMATVAVDLTGQCYVAYTGTSLEVISYINKAMSRTIPIERGDAPYPMDIAFGESGKVLAMGTDKGRALLYELSTAQIIQTMEYPKGGIVQRVTTCTTNDYHIVAYSGSSLLRPADVILYRKARHSDKHMDSSLVKVRRCAVCRDQLLFASLFGSVALAMLSYELFARFTM
ncbi:WD40-repeat-containing domain protein [Schizophyllum commune]